MASTPSQSYGHSMSPPPRHRMAVQRLAPRGNAGAVTGGVAGREEAWCQSDWLPTLGGCHIGSKNACGICCSGRRLDRHLSLLLFGETTGDLPLLLLGATTRSISSLLLDWISAIAAAQGDDSPVTAAARGNNSTPATAAAQGDNSPVTAAARGNNSTSATAAAQGDNSISVAAAARGDDSIFVTVVCSAITAAQGNDSISATAAAQSDNSTSIRATARYLSAARSVFIAAVTAHAAAQGDNSISATAVIAAAAQGRQLGITAVTAAQDVTAQGEGSMAIRAAPRYLSLLSLLLRATIG